MSRSVSEGGVLLEELGKTKALALNPKTLRLMIIHIIRNVP